MRLEELRDYLDLMELFQLGQINAREFQTRYFTLFKNDQRIFPNDIFDILNRLFTDADCYVADVNIRDENDFNEEQLLSCSHTAYKKLGNA